MNSLGSMIKEIRLAKSETQQNISKAAQITQSNFSKFEKNALDIRASSFIRILNAINIHAEEFCYLRKEPLQVQKDALLQQFSTLPFTTYEPFEQLKEACTLYYQQTPSSIIQEMIKLIEGLKYVILENNARYAQQLCRPLLKRILQQPHLFYYDYFLLHALTEIYLTSNDAFQQFLLKHSFINTCCPPSCIVQIYSRIIETCIHQQHTHIAAILTTSLLTYCQTNRLYYELAWCKIYLSKCLDEKQYLFDEGIQLFQALGEHNAVLQIQQVFYQHV